MTSKMNVAVVNKGTKIEFSLFIMLRKAKTQAGRAIQHMIICISERRLTKGVQDHGFRRARGVYTFDAGYASEV